MILWTDGSAEPNPGKGGFAVIEEEGGEPVVLGCEEKSTNIRMEAAAIFSAMKYASGEEVEIHTDSNFWVKTLTEWAPMWEKNNWTKKTQGAIKNLELVKLLYYKYKRGNVKLIWTRGHAGTELNEKADEWANFARKKKWPENFEKDESILRTIEVMKGTK